MKATAAKFGGTKDPITGPMNRAQALHLKALAEEAYQPEKYAADLSFEEAARRIDTLEAEIALANSF